MPSLFLLILFMHASILVCNDILRWFWLAWKYSLDSEYIAVWSSLGEWVRAMMSVWPVRSCEGEHGHVLLWKGSGGCCSEGQSGNLARSWWCCAALCSKQGRSLGPWRWQQCSTSSHTDLPKAGTSSVLGVSRNSSGKVGGVGADTSVAWVERLILIHTQVALAASEVQLMLSA